MKPLLGILILFSLGACAPKVLILQSPVISMTKNNTRSAKGLAEGKAISAKWCTSEGPVKENDDGSKHYGMIDQVVYRAHKKTKADFFVNNQFYQQDGFGGSCVSMKANVGTEASGEAGTSAAPAASPKKTGKNKM